MNKLLELFKTCLDIPYECVGVDVNYAFKECDKGKTLQIYFQCSNSRADWFANFFFPKKAYGLFKVHRGFYECYYQCRNIILDKVYSKDYEEVIIVGYSHGSALVQLALQDIVWHFPNLKVEAYAFESPRCLKVPKRYRYYWDNLTRIEDNWDLVCHVPPKIFGFDDLGKLIKINGNTNLIKKHIPKCIKSHYPQVVINGLEKIEH